MTETRRVPGIDGELLECPLWCPREHVLWFVDIVAPALYRHDPATGAVRRYVMPADIGSFALAKDGGLIVALRTGIHRFDPASGRLALLAAADYDQKTIRFNDGRCDRQGRFFVGSMYEPRDGAKGALYRLDPGGRLARVVEGVTIANGLAFSPDGRIAYFADSPTRRIWRFDVDLATGALSNRRPFATLSDAQGRPDGAAVDAEGGYWVAGIDAGVVHRFRPDGRHDRSVAVPSRWPTMPAFGGADMRDVYVTSLRHRRPADQLAASPDSGGLFVFRSDVPGLAEPRYAG